MLHYFIYRSEPRYIQFQKDNGVGIRLSGGNKTGVFVADIASGTPAERNGLREGDVILKVNDIDFRTKTREDAVDTLMRLKDYVTFLVQHRATGECPIHTIT